MNRKHNREKQAAVLHRAQEQRKQQKREQVFRAVEELLAQNQPLTFPNIALVAGCSVSYLYKWTEITSYIHDLQNQKTQQFNTLEQKEPGAHSLKTLHEVSKQRIRELETENRELKRQNEKLRGYVAEIFELRDESEKLRLQLRQLTRPKTSTKVVPLHSDPSTTNKMEQSPQILIEEELGQLGIPLNNTLSQAIQVASKEKVRQAIEALKDQLTRGDIKNPGGWLLKAIENGWTKSESIPQHQLLSPPTPTQPTNLDSDKSLVSVEQLKSLSQIFSKVHDSENTSSEH